MTSNRGRRARAWALSGCAALALGWALPAAAQQADSGRRVEFQIPAQDLSSALSEFARQSGQQLLYSPDIVRGKDAPGISGELHPSVAIDQLLAGSGLTHRLTSSGAILVEDPSSPIRLGDASGAAPSDEGATSEILVIGSRSLNTDIRRTEDDAQPYIVFNSSDIETSQAFNLDEFLATRLTANGQHGLAIQDPGGINNLSNNGAFNLRGLGSNQTLVLVDGQRIAGVADGNGIQQGNIAGIPLSAIERIEVLPSTASAMYGGGATGGVINVVLKRDYSGLTLDGGYGSTFDGEAQRTNLGLTGGLSFNGGRTRVMVTASSSAQDSLMSDQRDFNRRSAELLLRNDPSSFFLNILLGDTANVVSSDGSDLVLDGGATLGSPRTFVPYGYSGPSSDGGAALASNAGERNFADPTRILSQAPSFQALGINVRQEVTSRVEAFLDVYADRYESTIDSPVVTAITLAAASPDNPFQQDINAAFPILNLTTRSSSDLESTRVRAGIIFRLSPDWSTTGEVAWGRTASTSYTEFANAPTLGGASVLETIALQDLNRFPVENPNGLYDLGYNRFGPAEVQSLIGSLRFSGPVLAIPGGQITLSGLLEQRHEETDDFLSEYAPSAIATYTWNPSASLDVSSFYLETRAPLFSHVNSAPLVRELELMIAARIDSYELNSPRSAAIVPSPSGPFPPIDRMESELSSTDATFGLRYAPTDDITFRASIGTGFLPPSLSQLGSIPGVSPATWLTYLIDPRRGNGPLTGDGTGNVSLLYGGNPNLRPEESESLSYGFVFQPSFLNGFRLSIDYTQIEKTDEITGPFEQFIISNEDLFPGRVQRGPNLPGDPSDWSGPIIFIDSTALNIARSDVRAIDYQLDYERDTETFGTWRFYVVATQQTGFERTTLPGAAAYDSVGAFDGPLEWRGNLGIDWSAGNWRLGWNAQYFDEHSVLSADPNIGPFVNPLRVQQQGQTGIERQVFHDAFVSYAIPVLNAQASLGIQNIFDEEPVILAPAVGTYSTYADPRLRRFTLAFRKQFN